jgi:hypothetical protein
MSANDYLVELTTRTGMDQNEWEKFVRSTPEAQLVAADAYRAMSWSQDNRLSEAIAILETAGAVAGAASAIIALKTLL